MQHTLRYSRLLGAANPVSLSRERTNQRGLTWSDHGRFNVFTDEGTFLTATGRSVIVLIRRIYNISSGIMYMQLLVIFFLIFRVTVN